MTLDELVKRAREKENFIQIDDYAKFCFHYLEFISNGLQAVIVSQNENDYRFFQYKEDGHFSVTRPINNRLMLSVQEFENVIQRKRLMGICLNGLFEIFCRV